MEELNIPANHVVQHYDVCAKNCPSAIRAKGDWERFKAAVNEVGEGSAGQEKTVPMTDEISACFPEISEGCTGAAVRMLQALLEVEVDGIFGAETKTALQTFQRNTAQEVDGVCGKNSWEAVVEHMKANTYC